MKHYLGLNAVFSGCVFFAAAVFPAGAGQIIAVPTKGVPTIQAAMIAARAGDTVLVANGIYKEKVLVKSGVLLKAQSQFGAAIDGNSRGTVVTLAGNAGICGCEIRNGQYRQQHRQMPHHRQLGNGGVMRGTIAENTGQYYCFQQRIGHSGMGRDRGERHH